MARGLADAEYFAILDGLLTRWASVASSRGGACGAALAHAPAALNATARVVWNFSDVPSNVDEAVVEGRFRPRAQGGGALAGRRVDGSGKHFHYDQPYSTNTSLMHEVLDGVAMKKATLVM